MIRVLLIVSIFACSLSQAAPQKTDIISDRGYFTKTPSGRFYFVRDPRVIDPGIEVEAKQFAKGTFCVLETGLDCPPQDVSFRLQKSARGALIVDLKLETESAWHRLNRMQKAFAP